MGRVRDSGINRLGSHPAAGLPWGAGPSVAGTRTGAGPSPAYEPLPVTERISSRCSMTATCARVSAV